MGKMMGLKADGAKSVLDLRSKKAALACEMSLAG